MRFWDGAIPPGGPRVLTTGQVRRVTLRILLAALGLYAGDTRDVKAAEEPKWRGLVVVLVPPTQDDVTRNALARISGELAAAPFRTITHTIEPLRDVMTQVERAGVERDATAAFAIVRENGAGGERVTIWVSNRLMGTTSIHRMHVEDGDVDRAATRVAVEAVELVRASLAGVWPTTVASAKSMPVPAPGQTAPATSAATAEVAAAPASSGLRSPFALALTVGLLQNVGGPRFWVPNIAVTYGAAGRLSFRASLAALGPGATVSTAGGSAQLQRTWLTVGVARFFRPDSAIQPFLGLGAGLHFVSASGAAPDFQMTYDRSAFSGAATATAGLAVRLGSRVALTLATDVLMIWPTVTIRIVDLDAATLRGPALFPHGGLRASF